MTVRVNFMYSGERIKLPLQRGFSFAEFRALMTTWTQALGDALAAAKDHLNQTEIAVRVVRWARPDMTASNALG